MNRTVFLVDGFNLYHSLVEAEYALGGVTTKWLDLNGLCASFLPILGRTASERANLERVYYFSAPPTHRSPRKLERHRMYMKILRKTGVNVELARFKRKEVFCSNCKKTFIAHEEKETDVAIATKLFEVCHSDEADAIVLMTGDTDLAPAVRVCKQLFPAKMILFAFPYKRTNVALTALAPESFKIKLKSYKRHQFPDPLILQGGKKVCKPPEW